MGKAVISCIGQNSPGVSAIIFNELYEQDCNIENVHQVAMQSADENA